MHLTRQVDNGSILKVPKEHKLPAAQLDCVCSVGWSTHAAVLPVLQCTVLNLSSMNSSLDYAAGTITVKRGFDLLSHIVISLSSHL